MHGGAWRAAVHGSQRGRHRLKRLSTHTRIQVLLASEAKGPHVHLLPGPRGARGELAGSSDGPSEPRFRQVRAFPSWQGTAGCSKPSPSFHRKGNRGPERAKALLKTARRGSSGRPLAPSLGALPCPGSLRQASALEPLLLDRTEGCLSDVVTSLLGRARGQGQGGRKEVG